MGAPTMGSTFKPSPAVGGKGSTAATPTPAPGGKTAAPGTVFNPSNPNNVPLPAQGKGATPSNVPNYVQPYMPIGAQGGKAQLTPEQQAQIATNIKPAAVQPTNPYLGDVAAPQLADTVNALTPQAIPSTATTLPQVQPPSPLVQPPPQRQFDPRMMYYMEMQKRQLMEQQRRRQEMLMRLPPRLRQNYMQQGVPQPSNLGLGGLGNLLRGMP